MPSIVTLCLAVLCLLCSPSRGGETAGAQYCHHEDPQSPALFCVDTTTSHNASTGATDLSVTFGYEKSEHGGGWTAIGLGSRMKGALMFVAYSPESSSDEVILSVRAGSGHSEPRPSEDAPAVETLATTLDEGTWADISFVCYGCGGWASAEALSAGGTQQWIWATNNAQSFDEASVETKLKVHNHYGHFSIQMTGHGQDAAASEPASTTPAVDSSPSTSHGKEGGSASYQASSGPETWVQIHGSLLILGLMILFPCGAVAIRSGSKKSFNTHLYFQLAATICCLAGAAVAMFSVGFGFSFDSPFLSHMLFGMVLMLLIPLQISLGYLHHKAYKLARQSPKTTKSHVWIGRLIVVGGCLNAMIGLRKAGASTFSLVFVSSVSLIDISILIGLYYVSNRESARKMKEISADEDSVPFLQSAYSTREAVDLQTI